MCASPGRPRCSTPVSRRSGCIRAGARPGWSLALADDPVAAALELASGPAGAPREVVLATKATMRATASPGSQDNEQHEFAMRTELGPQANPNQSPEFAARLAAARRR